MASVFGRKCIGASTCVKPCSGTFTRLDVNISPSAWLEVTVRSGFQRQCGNTILCERSTMRMLPPPVPTAPRRVYPVATGDMAARSLQSACTDWLTT